MMNHTKRLALAAAVLTILVGVERHAQAGVVIDFEDGENHAGAQIGTHYESLGVTFANAIWIGAPFYGSHGEPSQFWFGKSGLGVQHGVSPIANPEDQWAFPGKTSPIVATFDTPVGFVSIDALDVQTNGAGLRAFDAAGHLLGEDLVKGKPSDIRASSNHMMSVTAAGIAKITLDQPYFDGNVTDGVGWDNLRFGQPTPEPSSFTSAAIAVILGSAYAWRRRRVCRPGTGPT